MSSLFEHRHAGAVLALLADGSFVALDALTQVMELNYAVPVGEILFVRMVRPLSPRRGGHTTLRMCTEHHHRLLYRLSMATRARRRASTGVRSLHQHFMVDPRRSRLYSNDMFFCIAALSSA